MATAADSVSSRMLPSTRERSDREEPVDAYVQDRVTRPMMGLLRFILAAHGLAAMLQSPSRPARAWCVVVNVLNAISFTLITINDLAYDCSSNPQPLATGYTWPANAILSLPYAGARLSSFPNGLHFLGIFLLRLGMLLSFGLFSVTAPRDLPLLTVLQTRARAHALTGAHRSSDEPARSPLVRASVAFRREPSEEPDPAAVVGRKDVQAMLAVAVLTSAFNFSFTALGTSGFDGPVWYWRHMTVNSYLSRFCHRWIQLWCGGGVTLGCAIFYLRTRAYAQILNGMAESAACGQAEPSAFVRLQLLLHGQLTSKARAWQVPLMVLLLGDLAGSTLLIVQALYVRMPSADVLPDDWRVDWQARGVAVGFMPWKLEDLVFALSTGWLTLVRQLIVSAGLVQLGSAVRDASHACIRRSFATYLPGVDGVAPATQGLCGEWRTVRAAISTLPLSFDLVGLSGMGIFKATVLQFLGGVMIVVLTPEWSKLSSSFENL